MEDIRYEAPATVAAAVKLLAGAKGTAKVLAGGTDLLVQMRSDIVVPSLIVDIKKIADTGTIKKEKGGWRIGASVPCAVLGEQAALVRDWPGVVEAAELIGSTQVQGRATLAGNLCNASPAADSVPALIAAGATVAIAGPKGKRTAKAEEIAVGPGRTSLQKGEFVVSVFLPPRPKRASDAYLRFIPRTEMDIAVVGCGIALVLDKKGLIEDARVSLGAVAPTPLLVKEAAKAIVGTSLDAQALEALAAAASAACRPIDDKRGTKEFRIKVAGVLARRAAETAYERARAK